MWPAGARAGDATWRDSHLALAGRLAHAWYRRSARSGVAPAHRGRGERCSRSSGCGTVLEPAVTRPRQRIVSGGQQSARAGRPAASGRARRTAVELGQLADDRQSEAGAGAASSRARRAVGPPRAGSVSRRDRRRLTSITRSVPPRRPRPPPANAVLAGVVEQVPSISSRSRLARTECSGETRTSNPGRARRAGAQRAHQSLREPAPNSGRREPRRSRGARLRQSVVDLAANALRRC